jgi:hypothetical protein
MRVSTRGHFDLRHFVIPYLNGLGFYTDDRFFWTSAGLMSGSYNEAKAYCSNVKLIVYDAARWHTMYCR